MNSIERVRGVLAGTEVDRLPAQPLIMMFAAKHVGVKYIDYTRDGAVMASTQLRFVEDFGMDCLMTCSDPAREVIDIAGDESVDWFEDQGPAINEGRAALRDMARLKSFRVPDPTAPGRMYDRIRAIEIMRAAAGPGMSIVGWVEGPLALAAELRGVIAIMTDFIENAPFVHALLDFCADVAIAYAPPQVEAGADTIAMSDAAASLIGPQLYGQFVLPRQMRVLESIKRRYPHVVTRLHMCGRTDPLMAQMKTLPADILELDFPVDLAPARQALGPDRVILGNVSTITDLMEGTPDKVYQACRRCHEICGRYHIVGAGCEVSPRTPPDNLRAMIQYARDHRP